MVRQMAPMIAAALYMLSPSIAAAQDVLDRTVGPDASGKPLEFRAFTLQEIGALSQAARVPIGFERLPAPVRVEPGRSIVLTGRTVREAVAAMISADPRYESREDRGVILFEPRQDVASPAAEAQPRLMHPLDAPAPAVRLGEATPREAFALVATLLGAPRSTAIAFSDTKPFVLDAPEGTIRSLLNAIVRSHGELVWVFERSTGRKPLFPFTLSFMSGVNGWGLGLSGRRSEDELDRRRFTRPRDLPANIADAIVGMRTDGYPLILTGVGAWATQDLSAAAHIPIGMQVAPGPPPQHLSYAMEFTATGRTLREVLDVLVARDNRYEWRVVDGTIVIRPVTAWQDSNDVLFSLVPDVDLDGAPMTEAVKALISALGGGDQTFTVFPDSKPVSLSVWHGTALDLLTALAKSHGSLVWTLQDAEPNEVQGTQMRHRLTLGVAGGVGVGVLVP